MSESQERTNFIWDAIDEDLKSGRCTKVHTRFPPEPNGHLHIGHCKALVTASVLPKNTAGFAICALTIQILPRKKPSTSKAL